MKTTVAIALWLLGATGALAGAATPTSFADPRRPAPEVLVNVPLKSVVTEFLDPAGTGVGQALASIVWSEIAAATSDQAGSGVVLVVSDDDKEMVTLLADQYHEAALRIAGEQRARMVLWGVVEPASEDSVAVQTYLSVLTKDRSGDLRLRWNDVLEAGIRRTRFNFAPVVIRKDDLARRSILTRATTKLFAAPRVDAPVAATVPANTMLKAGKLAGPWFEVIRQNGDKAYVRGPSVWIVPQSVTVPPQRARLSKSAGQSGSYDPIVDLSGNYPVSNMVELPAGVWYEIKAGERSGWIEGSKTKQRPLLPAEQFVAGLYRYYNRRFGDAADEFRNFVRAAAGSESNVNLAAAWQLAGASDVMAASNVGEKKLVDGMEAFDAFDRAVRETPYDPSAYMLRCVADAAILRDATRAIADLDRALTLDPDEPDARTLAVQYRSMFTSEDPKSMKTRQWSGFAQAKEMLEDLLRRHGIVAADPR